ncbi:MAG: efflux RND transporter periplasmic adaptor subunit [Burkholderiales bacterium]|nr:efflux RND transporter periplasmic adaptor subunit [Burkholderiales bacterium]OJX04733.1 MAG: hypothetical protein BGO72_13235 [Burkholderiales bacterium 70-64]
MKRILSGTLLASSIALAGPGAFAHGDEPHGDEPHGAVAPGPAGAATNMTAPAATQPGGPGLFVPKPLQRRWGLRTSIARIAEHAASVELNGKVVADPDAGGRVQATQPGRIEPGPRGLPVLGQRVAKGQVLAWLRPASDSIARGNQQAQLAELDAQFSIAQRKVARYDQLEDVVPRRDIEAARFELQALARRRAAVAASLSTPEALRAPVSGVVSVAAAIAGQVVDMRDILFEIVDPTRLAVEALAYDASLAQGIRDARAAVAGATLRLEFVGGGRQLRGQALPLLFRVEGAKADLAIGQPLAVVARTARLARGVALAREAVVREEGGASAVWIHTEPEQFERRRVRTEPLDAATVLVTEGLDGGERVVVAGAGALARVR